MIKCYFPPTRTDVNFAVEWYSKLNKQTDVCFTKLNNNKTCLAQYYIIAGFTLTKYMANSMQSACGNTRVNTHSRARTHVRTHARTHIHTHTLTHTHAHTHTHTHAHTHTHTHTHAHTLTHTHTHTHAHTHTDKAVTMLLFCP